jgi:hypothetical protein
MITACWQRYSHANEEAYGPPPPPPQSAARSLKVHTIVDIKHLHSYTTVQLGVPMTWNVVLFNLSLNKSWHIPVKAGIFQ